MEWLIWVDNLRTLLAKRQKKQMRMVICFQPSEFLKKDRSQRLHWINHHIQELSSENIEVFSVTERDQKKRCDITKTYVYDKKEKYVIVLECQRKSSYYLLTAYYLNKEYAEKGIKKKNEEAFTEY